MYDKYVRGKSVLACKCQEFQQAKQNAIDFTEQFLLQQGYTLSILYNCECIDSDGRTTTYKVTIENIPQQLQIF
jgi:hypothetical protein